MKPRVLLVGATGVFGERFARRLATWQDIELVLAARSAGPLKALAEEMGAHWQVLDRGRPDLGDEPVFCVIDCAGPFQGSDDILARAALAKGAHYVDIADSRAFVAAFPGALAEAAKTAGRAAVTGASSTPGLSHAALDHLTGGWKRIDSVKVAITPGARTPQGPAVVEAILSWVGQPVQVFQDGDWRDRAGWSLLQRWTIPGLGKRWLVLADTPDLDQLVERYRPIRDGLFLAGLESPILTIGLWLAAWPVRWGWVRSLAPAARPLKVLAGVLGAIGSGRGGMEVRAEGLDAAGDPTQSRWTLTAPPGLGPNVPTLCAQALLRQVLAGAAAPGARSAAGQASLESILAEADGLGLTTLETRRSPAASILFHRALGPAFGQLPIPVQTIHGQTADTIWRGQARARGARGLAAIARAFAGIAVGKFADFSVRITPDAKGEVWERRFGDRGFRSRLADQPSCPGMFSETLGALTFMLRAEAARDGFDWTPLGWRLGPIPLPRALAPRISARSFARDGAYRFRVRISHPWTGLIVCYAGSLATGGALEPR